MNNKQKMRSARPLFWILGISLISEFTAVPFLRNYTCNNGVLGVVSWIVSSLSLSLLIVSLLLLPFALYQDEGQKKINLPLRLFLLLISALIILFFLAAFGAGLGWCAG